MVLGVRVRQLRASQEPESQGGVGYPPCLVTPTLAIAGTPWAAPMGSWHTTLLAEIGGKLGGQKGGKGVTPGPWAKDRPCTQDKHRES